MMIQPTGVWTVREAQQAGWELMVPREHAGFDSTLVLMRHKHDPAHWELGWARDTESTAQTGSFFDVNGAKTNPS